MNEKIISIQIVRTVNESMRLRESDPDPVFYTIVIVDNCACVTQPGRVFDDLNDAMAWILEYSKGKV